MDRGWGGSRGETGTTPFSGTRPSLTSFAVVDRTRPTRQLRLAALDWSGGARSEWRDGRCRGVGDRSLVIVTGRGTGTVSSGVCTGGASPASCVPPHVQKAPPVLSSSPCVAVVPDGRRVSRTSVQDSGPCSCAPLGIGRFGPPGRPVEPVRGRGEPCDVPHRWPPTPGRRYD